MDASRHSPHDSKADDYHSNWSEDVTKDNTRLVIPTLFIMLTVLISACGESGDTTSMAEPDVGSATTIPIEAGSTISGRVADGYIQGATVCLDLNDNDACEANEPSAVTGAGGTYNLTIPAGTEGKQVVADIPATAIDEDTGEAVGQALVFSSPVDRPEFISPITTLIRQAVKSNPALDSDEAEQSVKADLGLNADDDVSLFEDYVAKGNDDQVAPEEASHFRYIHETARVVASMMKDIQTQVSNATVQSGEDIAGNEQTRQAIRELVRTEVRQLLPQIAEQVSQIVSIVQPSDNNTTSSQTTTVVNSEQIALNLRPGNIADNISERIESIVDRPDTAPVSMETILSAGIYWIESDCDENHSAPGSVNHESPVPENAESTTISDDPDADAPTGFASSDFLRDCQAMYGHVQLDESGEQLTNTLYEFDELAGNWIESIESTNDTDFYEFALIDDQWVRAQSVEPSGAISFADDGSATVTNINGKMKIKAISQMLSGVPVGRFLWNNADSSLIPGSGIDTSTLFNSGSEAYNLTVDSSSHDFILFNHLPSLSEDGDNCSQYGGNCNVARANINGQLDSVSTLDTIREASQDGIELALAGYGGENGDNATLKLTAQVRANGSMPEAGTATWGIDYHHSVNELIRPEADLCRPAIPSPLPGNEGPDEAETPVSQQGADPDDSEFSVKPDNELIPPRTPDAFLPEPTDPDNERTDLSELEQEFGPDSLPDPCELLGDDTNSIEVETLPDTLSSNWRLVTHGTVTMIQIELPIALRHGNENNGNSALLLIEHDGFVRVGARLNDSGVDSVVTYNDSAFVTLKEILTTTLTAP